MTKKFCYIRVSDKDQNVDRQLEAIKGLQIDERDVFIDKQSGKDFERANYQALKKCLRQGDLLIIKAINRLGRNYREIKKEWEEITQVIKADIRVLDMPLLDTTQFKDLLGTFISDLILQVLAYVAEQERQNIKQSQAEGIAAAKTKGVKLGRPKIEYPADFERVYKEWKDGNITAVNAFKTLNLTKPTFYRLVNQYEGKNK